MGNPPSILMWPINIAVWFIRECEWHFFIAKEDVVEDVDIGVVTASNIDDVSDLGGER